MSNYSIFEQLLSKADITINGTRPWDIQIHSDEVYERLLRDGSLALGETYMDGLWDCESIDEMINRILKARLDEQVTTAEKMKLGAKKLKQFFNPQSIQRSKEDVSYHYNTGNDLFEKMLDKYMAYTCAYWRNTDSLDVAQEQKLDLVCRKLGLEPGMRVLDIGCGWGSFMNYAAKHYGVICDGLTLSAEQVAMGKEKCAGLPINFILTDYREFQPEKPYDRIVSIGMLEHVGPDNYDDYFKCAERFLASDGIFLLHTIGGDVSNRSEDTDPWIRKYIFPNGVIPSIAQLGKATEKRFNIEDLHNIGPDYDKTLMAWHENFEAAWPELSEKYGERFYRMWRYYLLSCAGGFRSRQLGVWQLALTKDGRAYPDCVRAI